MDSGERELTQRGGQAQPGSGKCLCQNKRLLSPGAVLSVSLQATARQDIAALGCTSQGAELSTAEHPHRAVLGLAAASLVVTLI